MYMKIHEFRKNLKDSFDKALHGEKVIIERGGVSYRLTAVGVIGTVVEGTPLTRPDKNVLIKKPLSDIGIASTPGVYTTAESKPQLGQRIKPGIGLCPIHGLPLDDRRRCLQKGCKYA